MKEGAMGIDRLWFDTEQVLIGGRWQAPAGGGTLPVEDPSTGAEIGAIARGTAADIDAAVAAAEAARAPKPQNPKCLALTLNQNFIFYFLPTLPVRSVYSLSVVISLLYLAMLKPPPAMHCFFIAFSCS